MKEKETPQAQGTSVSPQDVTGTKFSQFKKIESSENLEVVGVEGPVNVRMPLRTSNIATDPDATLFDGREAPELKNQLEVNRYLAVNFDELSQEVGQGLAEQEDIKERLEELEDDLGAIGKHRYELTASAVVNNGQFTLLDAEKNFTNVTADAAFITLSFTDYDNRPVPVENIDHGDHIRIQEMGAADVADGFVDFQALDDGVEGLIAVKRDAGNLAEVVPLDRYAISDKSDFATKAYSDRGDEALREEIALGEENQRELEGKVDEGIAEQEKLKDKVSALEGSTGSYQYKFSLANNNPRSGDFITKADSMGWATNPADVKYIYFGELDSDGRTPNFEGIKTGDVFRITGPAGEKVEWRVAGNANNDSKVITVGDLLSSSVDEFAEEVLYGMTTLSAFDPTGLATIDYVDERVDTKLEKTGDSMTGVLNMKDNYIAGVKDAASDTDAVNRRTLKKQMDGVLRQDASGHTAVDQPFRIRAKSDGDAYWTYIKLDNNEISMYHMADPKEWHHAAHRRYVDDTFSDAAKKKEQNTFTDVQTFQKSTYFQNSLIHNGKNADTITEVRGDHEDGTKQLWHKIRGTNRVSWICYPGQTNDGYKKCLEMEWDADANRPLVKLDYLQEPTNGRQPATKKYVDDKVAEAGGGSFAETGPTTPELQAGQLFYNTTDKVLYIGE